MKFVCSQVRGGNGPINVPIELPGMRGMLYSRPSAGGRGGDVYYVSICGSGLLSRLCLADVVGHGEAVSKVSAEIHRVLQRLMNWPDQRRVLRKLNRLLERKGLTNLTTAATLTYYPPSRSLSFSYAGHPPAWYFDRSDDQWRRLELSRSDTDEFIDGALAITPAARFTRSSIKVEPGDQVVLVTDGVLETPGATGELFGDGSVEAVLAAHRGEAPGRVADALLDALRSHGGSDALDHDDVTFLIVEVTDPPAGPAVWHVLRNRVLRPIGLVSDEQPNGEE
jgi:sigma-B regulation protein RsbU (phosphoserine phosphatase)